jgi:hypothetical protein
VEGSRNKRLGSGGIHGGNSCKATCGIIRRGRGLVRVEIPRGRFARDGNYTGV